MHYKVEGHITIKQFKDDLETLIKHLETETGKQPFIKGLDIYMRLEDESGRTIDLHDEELYIKKIYPDRFTPQVLSALEKKKKQVQIANVLGISQQRVSKIKKYLVENELLIIE